MKLEKQDLSHVLSSTSIPDVFFTEYLPQMPGNFVKIYLDILFLSNNNKEIKINDLSKKLALPIKDIQESFKYFEEHGLLIKKTNGYIIVNLQEMELHKLYKPKLELSPEAIYKNSQNQYRARAIENINNSYFQGMMTSGWYSDIELWFSKYLFDEQVMIALFNSCYNKSKLYREYVNQVANDWYNHNVKTFSDLEAYMQKFESINKLKTTIAKKLGFSRRLNEYENAYIDKWVTEYKYDLNVIEIALKLTLTKPNIGFEYIDKTISNWFQKGLKTDIEVKSYIEESKKANKKIQEIQKKSSYNDYNQRTYDNLDNLYANNLNIVSSNL